MKTSDLTIRLDDEWGCWIAFDGKTPGDSNAIGEGTTRDAAVADFWFCIHDGKTADLLPPNWQSSQWRLHDGVFVQRFDTYEEAIAFAEEHQYLTSPLIREI